MSTAIVTARERVRLLLTLSLALAPAAIAQDSEPVFDLGPGITPPRVTHQVLPKSSSTADGFRVAGTVLVGLTVDSKGQPQNVHVVKSLDKELDQNAIEAVMQWQFEPARRENRAVAVRVTVEIRFRDL